MRGVLLLLIVILISAVFTDTFARSRSYKRSGSNIYVSKKYKGHTCPKPRKIINAVYF
ncbi:MAG: hypothetical protein U0T77_05570 [Chitinophagales bacterium]